MKRESPHATENLLCLVDSGKLLFTTTEPGVRLSGDFRAPFKVHFKDRQITGE